MRNCAWACKHVKYTILSNKEKYWLWLTTYNDHDLVNMRNIQYSEVKKHDWLISIDQLQSGFFLCPQDGLKKFGYRLQVRRKLCLNQEEDIWTFIYKHTFRILFINAVKSILKSYNKLQLITKGWHFRPIYPCIFHWRNIYLNAFKPTMATLWSWHETELVGMPSDNKSLNVYSTPLLLLSS